MSVIKKDSTKKNFLFQSIYQFVILVIPFIQSPYLTRTLRYESLGVYSYSYSIAYYFVIVSMLGILKYGQRIIAEANNDNIERLKTDFWSLCKVHVIFSLFVSVLYLVFTFTVIESNRIVFILNFFYVISALFDITWLFYGIESFKNVVYKNLAVKIISFILIILLVKKPDDLIIYTAIEAISILVGQITLWPRALKLIPRVSVKWSDCEKHIKPLLVLSISVVAVTLYTVFDKTLLGLLSSTNDVAFYEYANKIVLIPSNIIGVIGTVLFPKACNIASKNDKKMQRSLFEKSLLVSSFFGFAAVFGLISIGERFTILYLGDDFATSGEVLVSLCWIVVISGLGDSIRTIYLLPQKRDKEYVIGVCLNAIINLVFSYFLISEIGIMGAVYGTILAELFGLIYQLSICRKDVPMYYFFKTVLSFMTVGTIMMLFLKFFDFVMPQSWLGIICEVISGGIIYFILSLVVVKIILPAIFQTFIKR